MKFDEVIYSKQGFKTIPLGWDVSSLTVNDAVCDSTDHMLLKCRQHDKILDVVKVEYDTVEYALRFYGVCPDCLEKAKKEHPEMKNKVSHYVKMYLDMDQDHPHVKEMAKIKNILREGID